MFELETEIAQWRRKMAKSVGREKPRLEELEGHLRDHLGQLVRTGVPLEEAFRTATARLGDPAAVSAEFRKTEPGEWRVARLVVALWVLVAVALAFVFGSRAAIKMNRPLTSDDIKHHFDAARSVADLDMNRWLADRVFSDWVLAAHVFSVTLAYLGAIMFGALGICFVVQWLLTGEESAFSARVGRLGEFLLGNSAALTLLGLVLAMIWAKPNLGRYWGWDPKEIGGGVVATWLILTRVFRWMGGSDRGVMLMGIGGGALTLAAWFGPFVVTPVYSYYQSPPQEVLHSYGFPPSSTAAIGFLALYLLFFLLGLLPRGFLRRDRAV